MLIDTLQFLLKYATVHRNSLNALFSRIFIFINTKSKNNFVVKLTTIIEVYSYIVAPLEISYSCILYEILYEHFSLASPSIFIEKAKVLSFIGLLTIG